ncbi:MAG TPA: 4-alpha-glucanotransferase [Chloroflexota bacterium]|nr:4-alpha-glucanotransferase [Chloroflexota bacterium]
MKATPSRASGILLHPTSLPGFGGIGTIGRNACDFVKILERSGTRLWQMLPLGPTGYGDSPYAALSAFAGNPLLIDLELLVDQELLRRSDLALPPMNPQAVDFGTVIPVKTQLLRKAFETFRISGSQTIGRELESFVRDNAFWLDDFTLFVALKDEHHGAPWTDWESELRRRDAKALSRARERLQRDIELQQFVQFLFFRQWQGLKRHANEHGISIVGDMPIFVAHDSADVWARQDLFELDDRGQTTVVAGVPPDYFSRTGQRWGNPHYRWSAMQADGYAWWLQRMRMMIETVDIIRLDHFRGFAAAWAIPGTDATAERGEWRPAPGMELFSTFSSSLGDLPLIAEDLGVITPDVLELRDRFHLPGMKILQFAFGSDAFNENLPHNLERPVVVYTGTHDNDTTLGWFSSIGLPERTRVCRYTHTDGREIGWDLIRLGIASVADMAFAPLQDVLGLGSSARMNLPGRADGNWTWRFTWDALTDTFVERLLELNRTFGRTTK